MQNPNLSLTRLHLLFWYPFHCELTTRFLLVFSCPAAHAVYAVYSRSGFSVSPCCVRAVALDTQHRKGYKTVTANSTLMLQSVLCSEMNV